MSDIERLTLDRINQPGPDDPILFYPKEFYVFDNFAPFQVEYDGFLWQTSEHAYQAARFKEVAPDVVELIKGAKSAHDAQKIGRRYENRQVENLEDQKKDVMKEILRHKLDQHPYVLEKLLKTGDRVIIEDSWRDSEWGWGKDKDGKNLLGNIWMELREEYIEIMTS
jgi:ribA/ribD-fused uncharacterized protein